MKRQPEDRAKILERERKKIMRSNKVPVKKKGAKATTSERAPGEEEFRKDMAIILKAAGYTNSQIAASIGEHKSTIKQWFADRDVYERYAKIAKTLTESARKLLHTYIIEAVHSLVQIARTTEDESLAVKIWFGLMDRGGLPVVSRNETKSEGTPIEEEENMPDLRNLTPEQQEELAQMQDKMDEFLAEVQKEKK